jgi:hypothetical protein
MLAKGACADCTKDLNFIGATPWVEGGCGNAQHDGRFMLL